MSKAVDDDEITGRLEGWFYVPTQYRMCGYLYEDIRGRFLDGTFIYTSYVELTAAVEAKEGDVLRTTFSRYKLGKPLTLNGNQVKTAELL